MIIAPSGRKFYREHNGCVMVQNERGIEHSTLILDACYRTYKIQSPDCNNSVDGLSDCQDGYAYIASDKTNQYTDPCLSSQNAAETFTDQFLDTRLFYKDNNSSKHNTDCICKQFSSTEFAAGWCKQYDACLPNIQTLVRLFCDCVIIDSLDPTVQTNKDQSLTYSSGGWFTKHIPCFAQSSSEYDYYYPWCVLSSGLVGCVGKCDIVGGVIPVCEYY